MQAAIRNAGRFIVLPFAYIVGSLQFWYGRLNARHNRGALLLSVCFSWLHHSTLPLRAEHEAGLTS
jgi:hypothetical protein